MIIFYFWAKKYYLEITVLSCWSSDRLISTIYRFVSCLDFVCTVDYPQGYLVSGSGDSTVSICKLAIMEVLYLSLFCVEVKW